jgi:hypothetical protein
MAEVMQSLGRTHQTQSLHLARKVILSSPGFVPVLARHYSALAGLPAELLPANVNYSTNDPANASIRDLLGVVLLELDRKWVLELQDPGRREPALALLLEIASAHKKMVFFRPHFFWQRFKGFFEDLL